nr:MAG TPA: hypothetical protein [Caudoviricetes sp.]
MLVDHALGGTCKNCNRKDFTNCELRTAFIHACVPVYDECADGCPYKVE